MDPADYNAARNHLLKDNGRDLIALEKQVTFALLRGLHDYAPEIKSDFDRAMDLRIFWESYAPQPRGRGAKLDAIPWGEVGEKVVEAHLYSMLDQVFTALHFPGIPYGHDVRFLTEKPNAFVQIDVKSSRWDSAPGVASKDLQEVVVSPNQVTGDGKFKKGLVTTTVQKVTGRRNKKDKRAFRPELSPFVVIKNTVYPVVTLYVKVVYKVLSKGDQPLEYLELACVPNGLLMFAGPKYHANVTNLLTFGKSDESEKAKKRTRTRIMLGPLSAISNWRCVKLTPSAGTCVLTYRSNGDPVPPALLPLRTGASSGSPAPS